MRSVLISIIQTRTELIRIQRHALADTVDSVSGTTANLHSAAADVVICLTSLNHLCGSHVKRNPCDLIKQWHPESSPETKKTDALFLLSSW